MDDEDGMATASFTVSECERLIDDELEAAKKAICPSEQTRHLNRAAAYAFWSEEGRRIAFQSGTPQGHEVRCRLTAAPNG